MKRLTLEIKITLVLILTIIAICGIGYYAYATMSSIAKSIEEEARPDENLILVKDISDHISVADISTRSYEITGKKAYLFPYYQAVVAMEKKAARLKQTNKTEKQNELADSILILTDKKIDVLNDIIQSYDNTSPDDAMDKVSRTIKKTAAPITSDTIILNKDSTTKKKGFFKRIFGKKEEPKEIPAVVQQRRDLAPMENEISKIKREQNRNKSLYSKEQLELNRKDSFIMGKLNNLIYKFEDGEKTSIRMKAIDADEKSGRAGILITAFCSLLVILLFAIGYIMIDYLKKSRESTKALKEAKLIAENLANAKESFLNSMSHEIRTPMNAISGFTDQLMSTIMDYEQRQYVEIIKRSTVHLIKIVNDILDFSKLNAGKMKFEEVPFHFSEVFEESIILFEFECVKKNIKLQLDINKEIPLVLVGDPGKLRQVVLNIVGNAIKFTDSGNVKISVDYEIKSKENIILKTVVEDSGMGIQKEKLDRVFMEFERLGDITNGKEGSGLGLSISKKILDISGGLISIESESGKGTKVMFEIPYPVGNISSIEGMYETEEEKLNSPNFEKAKFLIVDDAEYNRMLLKNILRKWKVDFDECSNGKEALDLINKNKYDIVLMDVVMPVMNGLDAMVEIRKIGHNYTELPVLMLTAAFAGEMESRAIASGANAVMAKPFSEKQLLAKINSILNFINKKESSPVIEENLIGMNANGLQAYFNLTELKRMAGADRKFFKEMTDLFIATTSDGVAKIKQFYKEENWKEVAILAHALSAPCKHLEAYTLCEVLKMVELAAHKQPGISDMHILINRLEEETEIVLSKLKEEMNQI